MLGKKTVDNIKAVASGSPSLLIQNDNNDLITASIYIDSVDEDYKHTVLGHLRAVRMDSTIDDRPVYKVTGISGAYPGFGSLVYQSMLIELSKLNTGALFISDRERVTGFATSIYDKMLATDEFNAIKIPVDNPVYSLELEEDLMYESMANAGLDADAIMDDDDFDDSVYLGFIQDGVIPYFQLNKAYEWVGNGVSMKYHNILLDNNEKRNLTNDDVRAINEEGCELGLWVEDCYAELQEVRDSGFKSLVKEKHKEPELAL